MAGVIGMNKKRADLRRLGRRVEQTFITTVRVTARPVQRLSPAPSAAADDVLTGLGDEIGTVRDHFGIDAEYRFYRKLDLPRSVIFATQATNRSGYQFFDPGTIGYCCGSQ